jgi:uncharacterized protein YdhG (YjbR/CyaY superfamily)
MFNYADVDEYIKSYPPDVQEKLKQLRSIIKKEAPSAVEAISYGMPGYKLGSPLVYFAGFKNHVSFFATPSGIENFRSELENYQTSKSGIRIPIDKPIPEELIRKIIKFRVEENIQMQNLKKKKGKK